MLFVFLFLAVLLPLILLALIGPKLILVKSVWVLAAVLSFTAGVMFIGYGGFITACGLLFVVSGVLVAITAVRSYLRVRFEKAGAEVAP
jgi:hypothetical protein